jgi:hypothetical protein
MSIAKVSNKQSSHPDSNTEVSAQQEQENKEIKVDGEVWSVECTVDKLQIDLCRAIKHITFSPENDGEDQRSQEENILTVHKYYRQAKELMKWVPIARPVPEFVINASDISPKVIEELEARIDNPPTFRYILKQAVGRIFENLDFAYYHMSVARNLPVRIEP